MNLSTSSAISIHARTKQRLPRVFHCLQAKNGLYLTQSNGFTDNPNLAYWFPNPKTGFYLMRHHPKRHHLRMNSKTFYVSDDSIVQSTEDGVSPSPKRHSQSPTAAANVSVWLTDEPREQHPKQALSDAHPSKPPQPSTTIDTSSHKVAQHIAPRTV